MVDAARCTLRFFVGSAVVIRVRFHLPSAAAEASSGVFVSAKRFTHMVICQLEEPIPAILDAPHGRPRRLGRPAPPKPVLAELRAGGGSPGGAPLPLWRGEWLERGAARGWGEPRVRLARLSLQSCGGSFGRKL